MSTSSALCEWRWPDPAGCGQSGSHSADCRSSHLHSLQSHLVTIRRDFAGQTSLPPPGYVYLVWLHTYRFGTVVYLCHPFMQVDVSRGGDRDVRGGTGMEAARNRSSFGTHPEAAAAATGSMLGKVDGLKEQPNCLALRAMDPRFLPNNSMPRCSAVFA